MKKVLLIGSLDAHGGVGHMIFEYCKNINKKIFALISFIMRILQMRKKI